ncbi:hypothetical protein LQF12_03840 [Ruania suaedae]|uniref:hypothetical protein n=1 Tax=Ruania suaedae TaxID=2897774 RepID=UPI001E596DA9|nr:hypothetical protein [Ruania suaedae]UFU03751.1 hypothetical protein LQF12_03840 [Ruania suaedae]
MTGARRHASRAVAVLALAGGLAACSEAAPAPDTQAGNVAEGSEADDADVTEAEASEQQEQQDAATADYLDVLFAESLHGDVHPAEAGRAYIEVAGERLDFDEVSCRIEDAPDAGVFEVVARGETAHGPTELAWSRTIGSGIGWAWEDEYVRLTLIGGTEQRELNDISTATAQREEGEEVEWLEGSGSTPLIRLAGTEASATGSLDPLPGAEDPLLGDFVAAVTCP